ncbi:hypothetical protein E2C01_101008 [Portunus trituberculatus]|uniref:Uncharacterized protein n=1 Tax=Portunus trituberculatus TaxID=210409 RepID=A0A5B7KKX3_PORTR|nr:hypothetical protein [Portunus trituberculatus]
MSRTCAHKQLWLSYGQSVTYQMWCLNVVPQPLSPATVWCHRVTGVPSLNATIITITTTILSPHPLSSQHTQALWTAQRECGVLR